jgi:DNA-binding response OmpR family regulator
MSKYRILHIDDERHIRSQVREIVEKSLGFNHEDTDDPFFAFEILSTAKKSAPDVLIMDVNLQKMNGKAVLKKIRKDWPREKLAIIVCTRTPDPATVKECMEMGINDLIIKPLKPDIFVQKLKAVLPPHPRAV